MCVYAGDDSDNRLFILWFVYAIIWNTESPTWCLELAKLISRTNVYIVGA